MAALVDRLGRSVTGVHQCALLERLRGGAAAGSLDLKVTVHPLGRAELELGGARLGASLEACVRAAVRQVKFEPFHGPSVRLKRSVALGD